MEMIVTLRPPVGSVTLTLTLNLTLTLTLTLNLEAISRVCGVADGILAT